MEALASHAIPNLSTLIHNLELEAVCSDYSAMAGGATTFWVEDLNGVLIASSSGTRRGRTARSALMCRQQVSYAACALGPSANSIVPFFARACQRELDHMQALDTVQNRPTTIADSTVCVQPSAADISGIAHDLNNLLGTITGNAELLEAAVGDSATGRRQAARILRACRLARLFITRLRSGEPSVERTQVDLSQAVAEVVEIAGARAVADVTISSDCAPEACRVIADPLAIEQLLLNLIINSLAAMSEHGCLDIELSLRPASDQVTAEVMLRVRDDGCGMDDETLTRVRDFDRKQGEERGLGLPLVARIVASHGGRIDIVSAPGHGTQVDVVLPAGRAEVASDASVEIKNSGGEGLHG